MSKSTVRAKRYHQTDLNRKFEEANNRWEAGKLRSAFRLFLIAAKAGDQGAQLNLGNFYNDGIGVKPNRAKALYWYRRAYRQGHGEAASNIGILFRDEKRFKHALTWFERAVKLVRGG
jgi:TPR repeat protein